MSKTIKYFYFLFLIINLISCNKENNKPSEVKKVSNKNGEKSLSEKIKSEPKIFLKYWENMTLDEFFEVTSLLSNEKIVENESHIRFYYLTDLCRVEFKHNFINKNSKTLTVYKKYTLEKSITYLSKKEYYNRKKVLENSIKKDSLENKIEEVKIKNRKEKSINEI